MARTPTKDNTEEGTDAGVRVAGALAHRIKRVSCRPARTDVAT
jgi:hypothetical protein